jgi:hypothetical protein
MKRFLFLMQGLPAEAGAADDQTRAYNRKWIEYMGSLERRGALENGAPLEPSGKTVSSTTATDTALTTPDIYGYMVVNAASLDEAIAIARDAPHMALGGTTIVRPCVDIPGSR